MTDMFKGIWKELLHHIPFTAVGAVIGMGVMAIIALLDTPDSVSEGLFFTFHPLHVVFSSLVTTSMYRQFGKGRLWLAIIVGYLGSVGIATLSDAVIPYLEGSSLNLDMHFHLPFIETDPMPFIGVPKWIVVNGAAALGIGIGLFRPKTTLPHMGHVWLRNCERKARMGDLFLRPSSWL